MAGIIESMDSPAALVSRGWAKGREQVALLLDTLQHWPWLDTVITLRQRFREDRLSLTASSLTFTTLIALVPLVTVAFAVFSAFPMFGGFQGAFNKYVLQALVPPDIAKPVLTSLTRFTSRAQGLSGAGLVLLVTTALALMFTIDRSLNAIWRVRRPRPIAQRVLVYWAALTLGPLLLGMSLTLTSYALSASQGLVSALPGGVNLLLNLVELTLVAGAVGGLFHYVPNTDVRWRHAITGGVFVALGIEAAKQLLGWYIKAVPTFSAIYGAAATLPIFFIWIYAAWAVVLLGAVIAAYAPSLSMNIVHRPNTPGHRFELAITVLRELAQARSAQAHGLSSAELAAILRIDPLQIEPVLDTLNALDWTARLDEEGAQRLVLLCEPSQTPAQPLIDQLLLSPTRATASFRSRAQLGALKLSDLLSQ